MTPALDGSRLCLACGLCCQGLLHDWARIEEGEIELADRLNLRTATRPEGVVFALPCHHHQGGRCTVYGERPSPCRDYGCKLLRLYLAGEVPWEEGLRRVEQVKRLLAEIFRRIGGQSGKASIWQQLRVLGDEMLAADSALRLDVAALVTLCQRHFRNRAEPRSVFGP